MNILQGTRQPPTNSKELSKPNMSVLARLRNPGLCSPAAYTHTHTHTHSSPYAHLHTPTSLLGSSRMMSCRGDPHEPVVRHSAHGEPHHFRADPSPPRRRRLISCSGPPWDQRETSQQMGFRLVTFSVARSDYINSSSSSDTHSCLMLPRLAFHLPRSELIPRQARRRVPLQLYLLKGRKLRNRSKSKRIIILF